MTQVHRSTGRFGLGLGLAATTTVLWATLPIALKVVLLKLDSASIIAVRFAISAAILAVALGASGKLPRFADLNGRRWILLVVATVFLAANYHAYMLGLDWTTAANAQVLIQLAPLLFALGGIFAFGEYFNRVQWFGLIVLAVGLALFSWDQLSAFIDELDRYLAGSAMIVVAAVTWAVYGMAQKQLLLWWPSPSIMLCLYAGCALLFAPWTDVVAVARLDPMTLATLLYCSLNTLVAYGCFAESLAHWEASRVSAVLALTPLTTLVLVWVTSQVAPAWIEPERLGWSSLAGAGLVVVGSVLVSLGQRSGHASSAPDSSKLLSESPSSHRD